MSHTENKILIGPSSFAEKASGARLRLEEIGLRVIDNPFKRKLKKEELMQLLGPEVVGIIAGLEPLDREVLSRSKLKVISRCGSGLDNVDQQAAKDLGIEVCCTPTGPVEAVAELTLTALLALLRDVVSMSQDFHSGKWTKKIGLQLEGKTVALIGFGRIGRRVAELLEPFHVRLLIVDPLVKNDNVHECLTLRAALPQADVITLHSSGSQCILGKQEFSIVKQGAVVLNAARGSLIDEKELVRALEEKRLRGAWCDVFQEEPYQGELTRFPNVILTPHVGSYTEECRREMELEAAENLVRALHQKGWRS